jgi:hypothetical protein
MQTALTGYMWAVCIMTFDTLLNCLLWWWLKSYMWAVCIMTFDTLLNCLLWWWLTGYMWAVCIMTFDTLLNIKCHNTNSPHITCKPPP